MKPISISMLTVCGLEELTLHGGRGVTHVLSILDPEHPEPEAFQAYGRHQRTVLRFHDAIEPGPNVALPEPQHVQAILRFGDDLAAAAEGAEGHLLVHCHAGISRSTAAMAMLMARMEPELREPEILQRLLAIRPKAWPNLRMMTFADELMARNGGFVKALGPLYRQQLISYPNIRAFMQDNGRARELALADAS
jgi:predicted protein tyrosine phosphatase